MGLGGGALLSGFASAAQLRTPSRLSCPQAPQWVAVASQVLRFMFFAGNQVVVIPLSAFAQTEVSDVG